MVSSKLRPITNPLVEKWFGPLGTYVKPNYITVFNLLAGALAGYLIFIGNFKLAALFVLLSGVADSMDGAISRARGMGTPFGAVLDAVLDRLSEGFVFIGLATRDFLAVPAIVVSYAISHTGVKEPRASKGIAERSERIILTSIFLFFGQIHSLLILLNIILPITLFQRLWSAYNLNK